MAALGSKQTRAHSYGVSIQEHLETGRFIASFPAHLAYSQKKTEKSPNLGVHFFETTVFFVFFGPTYVQKYLNISKHILMHVWKCKLPF